MDKRNEEYPEGHFVGIGMGVGLAVGACLGVPLGIVTGSPAFFGIGLPIGLAIGLAIGQSIESRHIREGKIRPLTRDKKKARNILLIAGIATLILGLLVFLLVLL